MPNDLRQYSISHRPEIQHSTTRGRREKLSTEEEESREILLDHITKNTRLGIDDKLRDDVTDSNSYEKWFYLKPKLYRLRAASIE